MKNTFVFLLALLLGAGAMKTAQAQTYAPGFIPNVTATCSGSYATNRSATQTVDNSGMTEAVTGSKTGTHGTATTTQWLIAGTPATTGFLSGTWIQFDLGSTHNLDEMWIWNYTGSTLYRSFKNVFIEYKANTTDANWTLLNGPNADKSFTLAKGLTSAAPATNLVNGAPVSFGNVPVRLVQMRVAGGLGVGNYGDAAAPIVNNVNDDFASLSEVRFYEQATAAYISPGSLNFGTVGTGYTKPLKLVLGGIGGNSSVTLTTYTFAMPNSKISFATPPTLPKTWNAGQFTTYTMNFHPSAIGLYQSTMTLTFTQGGVPATFVIPAQGTGVKYASSFIPLVTATTSTNYAPDRSGTQVVDGTGMTDAADQYGAKTATHDNGSTSMWLSEINNAANQWIQFDLGTTYTLSEMWIWNGNQSGYHRGIKDCRIKYGLTSNPATMTQLGGANNVFTLKEGTYATGQTATNLDVTGLPVTFGNVPVRYVRLEVVSTYDVTSGYVGLAEVRFYTPPPNLVREWSIYD